MSEKLYLPLRGSKKCVYLFIASMCIDEMAELEKENLELMRELGIKL